MNNKKTLNWLFWIYVFLVITKIIIALFIKSPSVFGDEYYYIRLARSFFYHGTFLVDNQLTLSYPPFYPALISLSYVFNDMKIIYFFVKILNSFVSSLIVIPIYLICKEFLDNKKSLLLTILIGILPPFFIISSFVMSENLFYPLFLLSIFFIYKSFREKNLKYDLLAGFFIGLSVLTRIIGIILIPLIILLIIFFWRRIRIKNKVVQLLIPMMFLLAWILILRSYLNMPDLLRITGYELTVSNALKTNYFLHGMYWIPLNLTYFILATGIIFFIGFFLFLKSNMFKAPKHYVFFMICSVLLFLFLVLSSFYNLAYDKLDNFLIGRPIERYFAVLLPFIIIPGAIAIGNNIFEKYHNKIKKIIILFVLLFLISLPLTFYSLFPTNNPSLIYFGLISKLLDFASYKIFIFVGILILMPLSIIVLYRLDIKKILFLFIAYFLIISSLNTAFILYNSNYKWYDLDETKIGLWLNDNDQGKSIVLFDWCDVHGDYIIGCPSNVANERPIAVIGFWLNDDIIVGDVLKNTNNINYIVTTKKLDYLVSIKGRTSANKVIYIYKIH